MTFDPIIIAECSLCQTTHIQHTTTCNVGQESDTSCAQNSNNNSGAQMCNKISEGVNHCIPVHTSDILDFDQTFSVGKHENSHSSGQTDHKSEMLLLPTFENSDDKSTSHCLGAKGMGIEHSHNENAKCTENCVESSDLKYCGSVSPVSLPKSDMGKNNDTHLHSGSLSMPYVHMRDVQLNSDRKLWGCGVEVQHLFHHPRPPELYC